MLNFTDFKVDPQVYSNAYGRYLVVTAKHTPTGREYEVATFPCGEHIHPVDDAKTLAEQFAYQMNLLKSTVIVPVLDIDKVLYKETNGVPHPRARLERIVVANLIDHLDKAGFKLYVVDDGEETTKVSTMKEAMELIFNLDDAMVYWKNSDGNRRWVQIVLGNSGWDSISDYSCPNDESDGWSKAMDAFDAEKFNNIY